MDAIHKVYIGMVRERNSHGIEEMENHLSSSIGALSADGSRGPRNPCSVVLETRLAYMGGDQTSDGEEKGPGSERAFRISPHITLVYGPVMPSPPFSPCLVRGLI